MILLLWDSVQVKSGATFSVSRVKVSGDTVSDSGLLGQQPAIFSDLSRGDLGEDQSITETDLRSLSLVCGEWIWKERLLLLCVPRGEGVAFRGLQAWWSFLFCCFVSEGDVFG